MVLVLPGGAGRAEDVISSAVSSMGAARANQARVAAVVLNQVPASEVAAVRAAADSRLTGVAVRVLPEMPLLRAPTVGDLLSACGGDLVHGSADLLDRECAGLVVAAMTMPHVLDRLIDAGVVIVPGDREDVVLGVLLAHRSRTLPSLSGLVLNGGFALSSQVDRLIDGLDLELPVISTGGGTMEVASVLGQVEGRITRHQPLGRPCRDRREHGGRRG